MSAIKTAVIYTRVSTAQQGQDGASLALQAQSCHKKAKEIGAQVVGYYEETMSGGLYLARPGIQQALSDIESGKANTLIIYRLDRTGRELDALRDVRRRVERAGGQLVFTDGMSFQPGAVGNFMFTQMGAVAELEREMIRDRTVRGLRAMAAAGRMPARSIAPYGYRIVKKADVIRGEFAPGEEGTYHIIEEQAAVVRLIFEQYLQLPSLRSLVGWLAENGYPSPTGKPTWLPATLRQILTRPAYKGLGVYGRRRHRFDESRLERGCDISYSRPAPPEEWTTFPVPAIVSVELWDAVQARLASGNRLRSGPRGGSGKTYRGKGVHKSRYLLTGLVFCPECGHRMYAIRVGGRDHIDRPHSFGCSQVFPRNTPAHAEPEPLCVSKRYDGNIMERLVIDAVCQMLGNPSLVTEAENMAAAQRAKKKTAPADSLTRLQDEIKKAHQRELTAARAALEARLSGSDGAAYEQLRATAETHRRELEEKLTAMSRESGRSRISFPLDDPSLCRQAREVLLCQSTPSTEKGDLLQRLVEKIYPVPIEETPVRRKHYNLGGVNVFLQAETPTGEDSPESHLLRNIVTSRRKQGIENCDIRLHIGEDVSLSIPAPDNRSTTE